MDSVNHEAQGDSFQDVCEIIGRKKKAAEEAKKSHMKETDFSHFSWRMLMFRAGQGRDRNLDSVRCNMSISSEGSMTLGALSAAWVVLAQSCSVLWGAVTAWANTAAGNHKWQYTEGELPYHCDTLCLVPITRKQLLSAQRSRKSRFPANWCLVCSSKESGLINGQTRKVYH